MFMKTLILIFKKDLIHQIIKSVDHYLQEKMKVIGLMKDKLGRKIMAEFFAFRPKTYSYLMGDSNCNKKAKGTQKCVIKRTLKVNDYKNCLLNNEIMLALQQKFKSEAHNVYTEKITRLQSAVMMIKDCELLIGLHHILIAYVLEKYVKQRY